MDGFISQWIEAVRTTLGFFWMAFWAFSLGYLISSVIQVVVTRDRMQRVMGSDRKKGVLLGTFFGFISSSCSFAALSTTRALFKKGAGFIPSLAFLLASTNLVIELGIVIGVFLSWHFIVGEYVGGLLLIGFMWLLVKWTYPSGLLKKVRERLGAEEEGEEQKKGSLDWRTKIMRLTTWKAVARQYFMEWKMVWKDVTFGFTVAGLISAFVPRSFFTTLFVGIDTGDALSFLQTLEHVLVAPLAAFFTFIGSMGNIPLAALLFDNGVSFAGIMAFIFSDLVVFPVLRINATYYGWKMSFYILGILFVSLMLTSLALHYGFDLLQVLPERSFSPSAERSFFKINYTFYLNVFFLLLSGLMAWLAFGLPRKGKGGHHHMAERGWVDVLLKILAIASYVWLLVGLVLWLFR